MTTFQQNEKQTTSTSLYSNFRQHARTPTLFTSIHQALEVNLWLLLGYKDKISGMHRSENWTTAHLYPLCVYINMYIYIYNDLCLMLLYCTSVLAKYKKPSALPFKLRQQRLKCWTSEPIIAERLLTHSTNPCERAGTVVRRFSTLALNWQDLSSLSSLHFVTLTFSLLSHHNYSALKKKGADYLWVRHRILRTKRVLEIHFITTICGWTVKELNWAVKAFKMLPF